MINLLKSFTKLLYYSTIVLIKSIRRSLIDEIRFSNEAAKKFNDEKLIDNNNNNNNRNNDQLSLDEAMKILNVDKLSRKDVERNFNILFTLNDKSNGGSFYVQSKIFRAKQVLDKEFNRMLKVQRELIEKEDENRIKNKKKIY